MFFREVFLIYSLIILTIQKNVDTFLSSGQFQILAENLTDDIIDVKCFWIKGLNVFDISSLEKTNE